MSKASTSAVIHRVYIEPSRRGRRGQLYTVRYSEPDGRMIVRHALDPEHAACRALAKSGLTGRLEVWDRQRPYPRLCIRSIEAGAKVTTRDDNLRGPTRVKYRALPDGISSPSNDNIEASEEAA